MDENKELQVIDEQQEQYNPGQLTMWNDTKLMRNAWKTAEMISKSALVPDKYRDKPADCLIAIDLANRMCMSPLNIMQMLYVVRGVPSWSGQACKAMIDGCGKYKKTYYSMAGDPGTMDRSCNLNAVNHDGQVIAGPMVSMKMAADEGWINKSGSKWKTMPENMLRYRAAAFFARTECPNILMGFQTVEEVQDVNGYEEEKQEKVVIEVK